MAREIESVHQFEHNPRYRLAKHMTVIRCDDGAIYQFEQAIDEPHPILTKSHQPDGSLAHLGSSSRLPDAVEETVDVLFNGWKK